VSQRERVEREIFNLRKKAGLCLQAGNVQEYNCILIVIAELQKNHGVTTGKGSETNERGNDTGSQCGD
jgi:hypothetical protein